MPLVTLISDLGTTNTYLSAAKAMLQSSVPGINMTDITHHVTRNDIRQAAYLSLSSFRSFPIGTTHLLLVGTDLAERQRLLLATKEGHYFIATDNGILSLAFGEELEQIWLCNELSDITTVKEWLPYVSGVINTINGQDIQSHYTPFLLNKIPQMLPPKAVRGGVNCNILHIDRYGNIVLNITASEFHDAVKQKPFSIKLSKEKEVSAISHHYSDVPGGAPLCRFNSSGFLEIAVNHGSAVSQFEIFPILARDISYQAITVNFS